MQRISISPLALTLGVRLRSARAYESSVQSELLQHRISSSEAIPDPKGLVARDTGRECASPTGRSARGARQTES